MRWTIFRRRFRGFDGRGPISDRYGENWPVRSPAKWFFTLHHLVEGAGSRSDLLESTSLEDLDGDRRGGKEPGTAQTGNNMESGIRTGPCSNPSRPLISDFLDPDVLFLTLPNTGASAAVIRSLANAFKLSGFDQIAKRFARILQ